VTSLADTPAGRTVLVTRVRLVLLDRVCDLVTGMIDPAVTTRINSRINRFFIMV